ncbi:hypothetical protein A8926_1483 [Saccharopolyspora spinosa]|uniref:Uncharacterized protein n=1 Tax=Saccharopolyspora spinosa TaxID=60894 RepID=A0A2N3XTA3_SACSN|nr:hypothetical protein A8926_1483 [Saccharopolyspora spinosa]
MLFPAVPKRSADRLGTRPVAVFKPRATRGGGTGTTGRETFESGVRAQLDPDASGSTWTALARDRASS